MCSIPYSNVQSHAIKSVFHFVFQLISLFISFIPYSSGPKPWNQISVPAAHSFTISAPFHVPMVQSLVIKSVFHSRFQFSKPCNKVSVPFQIPNIQSLISNSVFRSVFQMVTRLQNYHPLSPLDLGWPRRHPLHYGVSSKFFSSSSHGYCNIFFFYWLHLYYYCLMVVVIIIVIFIVIITIINTIITSIP